MKRRSWMKAVTAAPLAAGMVSAQDAAPRRPGAGPAAGGQGPGGAMDLPKLDVVMPDVAGVPVTRFFSDAQRDALKAYADAVMPHIGDTPGAIEAGVPEFLDGYLAQSPADRQKLYRDGLDALNARAVKMGKKAFSALTAEEVGKVLAPLSEKWTAEGPKDAFGKFLIAAKTDIRNATVNSREYNAAGAASGGRRFGATGSYWKPLE